MKIIHLLVSVFIFSFSLLIAENIDPKAEEILNFWFGELQSPEDFPKDKIILWFGKKNDTDKIISDRFEYLLQAASKNELNNWKETPKGRLALIILLDQFPRNIYRDTVQSFAYDQMAIRLTLEGIDKGDDLKLLPIERTFFYFPLMHAENKELQKLSLDKYKALVDVAPPNLRSNYKSYEDFALRHYDIISVFGRYPHRNRILCRESTPQEIEFLKTPGSSF